MSTKVETVAVSSPAAEGENRTATLGISLRVRVEIDREIERCDMLFALS